MNSKTDRPKTSESLLSKLTVAAALLIVGSIVLPLIREAGLPRLPSPESVCSLNVRRILLAANLYTVDWDDRFPPAQRWAQCVQLDRSAFHCPTAVTQFGYSFNRVLGGAGLRQVAAPEHTVAIFESNSTELNSCGGREDLVKKPRHGSVYVTGFADGHVDRATHMQGWIWTTMNDHLPR